MGSNLVDLLHHIKRLVVALDKTPLHTVAALSGREYGGVVQEEAFWCLWQRPCSHWVHKETVLLGAQSI